MSASSVRPIENDSAADWVADQVVSPLCDTIQKTLQTFLSGSNAGIDEMTAEAAAALLVDCTSSKTSMKYNAISMRKHAVKRDLWNLAISAIDKMITDNWPLKWNDPQLKLEILQELRGDLQLAHDESNGIRQYMKRMKLI